MEGRQASCSQIRRYKGAFVTLCCFRDPRKTMETGDEKRGSTSVNEIRLSLYIWGNFFIN